MKKKEFVCLRAKILFCVRGSICNKGGKIATLVCFYASVERPDSCIICETVSLNALCLHSSSMVMCIL